MKKIRLENFGILLMVLGLVFLFSQNAAFGDETAIIPINHEIVLEKTEMTLSIDKNDSRQWAFVKGKITNPILGHPVIIQILKDGEFVRIAQVEVDDNGNYEYQFRIKTVDDSNSIRIFEGDYTVKIFKVIKSPYEFI